MKHRPVLKIYRIEQETFDAPFLLCVGSDKEMTKYLNKVDPKGGWKESESSTYGSYYQFKKVLPKLDIRRIIWLGAYKGRIEDIGLLSHELLHYTFDTLHDKGLRISRDSDEAFTYFHEYSLRACLEALKNKK